MLTLSHRAPRRSIAPRRPSALCSWGILIFALAVALRADPPVEHPRPSSDRPTAAPAATLSEDLKTLRVPLLPNYTAEHPRLVFSASDLPALKQKATDHADLWNLVLASSQRLGSVPTPEQIKSGSAYWRIERVESGALACFVTGDKAHLRAALSWMIPYCQEKIWGTGFRDNLDLQASWYLYHLAIAYDILYNDLPKADATIIRNGLASHAKALFDSFDPAGPETKGKFAFDQNHTDIPAVALSAASLALLDDVPAAKDWLTRACAVMNRSRYVLGNDGYYFEGYGYWSYAMHWHVRYADLISRATGKNFLDLPALQNNWQYALQLQLPGDPGAFDAHDTVRYSGDDRGTLSPKNHAIFWDLATAAQKAIPPLGSAGDNKTVADLYSARWPDTDYPAASFLWFTSDIQAIPLTKIRPYHYFADMDVLTWRSGWDKDATCLLFRCGPPEGHAAFDKLKLLQDWSPNAGHVHPDIGAFYLYAKNTYLAVSTGYTAEKWTKDHNTLLVDDQGQGNDGSYWNDRNIPYEKFNQTRITASYLSDDYAYATGQLGPVYSHAANLNLQRSLLITKRWLLLVDDMSAPDPHTLTWLVHTDGPFKPGADDKSFIATLPSAALAVIPLNLPKITVSMQPAKVMAGTGPQMATETQRGYQLALTLNQPAKTVRLINLLVPLGRNQLPPAITSTKLDADTLSFILQWPKEKPESISLNLKWQPVNPPNPTAGPATLTAP